MKRYAIFNNKQFSNSGQRGDLFPFILFQNYSKLYDLKKRKKERKNIMKKNDTLKSEVKSQTNITIYITECLQTWQFNQIWMLTRTSSWVQCIKGYTVLCFCIILLNMIDLTDILLKDLFVLCTKYIYSTIIIHRMYFEPSWSVYRIF